MKLHYTALVVAGTLLAACHHNAESSSPGDVTPVTTRDTTTARTSMDTAKTHMDTAAAKTRDTVKASTSAAHDTANAMRDSAAGRMHDTTGKIPPGR